MVLYNYCVLHNRNGKLVHSSGSVEDVRRVKNNDEYKILYDKIKDRLKAREIVIISLNVIYDGE